MNLSKIIEEEQKKFDEKFYEGERNSVYCHKHNIFATPHEVKSYLSASLICFATAVAKQMLADVVEEIKNMKRLETDYDDEDKRARQNVKPYNEALSDILAHLTKQDRYIK